MAWLALFAAAYGFYRVWNSPPPNAKQVARGDAIDRVGLKLVLVFGGVASAFIAYDSLRGLAASAEAASFRDVPCRVLHADVRVTRPDGPPELGGRMLLREHHGIDAEVLQQELAHVATYEEYFDFEVLYEYSVAGRTYRSRNAGPWSGFPNDATSFRERFSRLATGAACWVNPRDPSQAVFDRRAGPHLMYAVLGTTVFVVVLMLAWSLATSPPHAKTTTRSSHER